MGYIRIKHRCYPPWVNGDGDIWECDECRRQWKSIAYVDGVGGYWSKTLWRRKKKT